MMFRRWIDSNCAQFHSKLKFVPLIFIFMLLIFLWKKVYITKTYEDALIISFTIKFSAGQQTYVNDGKPISQVRVRKYSTNGTNRLWVASGNREEMNNVKHIRNFKEHLKLNVLFCRTARLYSVTTLKSLTIGCIKLRWVKLFREAF